MLSRKTVVSLYQPSNFRLFEIMGWWNRLRGLIWYSPFRYRTKIHSNFPGCVKDSQIQELPTDDTQIRTVPEWTMRNYHEAFHYVHFLYRNYIFNPLNPELNPICYLLAVLGAHHFLHVSRIRVKSLTFRRLMSYIYGAPILDVSRSHTTTQHSR